jgi:hypothetical protein
MLTKSITKSPDQLKENRLVPNSKFAVGLAINGTI